MPQYKADEHDSIMQSAAMHSKYHGHDGKANAPLPFNSNPGARTVGEPDQQTEGGGADNPQGKKDAPQPFNAQKGKSGWVSTGLTSGRHGKTG